jgi:hypothetical protein
LRNQNTNEMTFSTLIQTQELWTNGVMGVRILTADEVQKYKTCSPKNGTDVKFVPYIEYTSGGGVQDKNPTKFVVLDPHGVFEADYSSVKFCSNPTW